MKRLNFDPEAKPVERKASSVVKIVAGTVLLVIILEIWMVNRLSTYGNQLARIKQQESQLGLENQILANQIAQDSSLLTIEQEAQPLGFSQIIDYSYLQPAAIASAR